MNKHVGAEKKKKKKRISSSLYVFSNTPTRLLLLPQKQHGSQHPKRYPSHIKPHPPKIPQLSPFPFQIHFSKPLHCQSYGQRSHRQRDEAGPFSRETEVEMGEECEEDGLRKVYHCECGDERAVEEERH